VAEARAASLRRVGVLQVDARFAIVRQRAFQPDHVPAKPVLVGPAFLDADAGAAVLGQPGAARIARWSRLSLEGERERQTGEACGKDASHTAILMDCLGGRCAIDGPS
jgi:hypothetical protein